MPETPHREVEALFHRVLEAAPDAIVVVDARGAIALVNAQTEALFGYARDELVGASVDLLVPEAKRGLHARHRERYEADPHRRPMGVGLELSGRRKDGSEFAVDISLSPMETQGERWIAAAIRDVTARVSIERALKAANEELEAFTHSASHDLRAPIRHVQGFARLLEDRYGAELDEEGRHYLTRIVEAAARMGALVDDLLHLAHIGQRDLRPVSVSLDGLVGRVVAQLGAEELEREIDWRVGALGSLVCDPGLMTIAFTNLLSNALKYTRPRARARIAVERRDADGKITLAVEDNGVGFDMKHAQKLFVAFQRLHPEEEFDGQGVGLATVQRIVRKHGGEVWAEGRPGCGATFYMSVPHAA